MDYSRISVETRGFVRLIVLLAQDIRVASTDARIAGVQGSEAAFARLIPDLMPIMESKERLFHFQRN